MVSNWYSQKGHRIIVTGAANGLGREISVQLSRRGCRVGIVDINAQGTAETAELIRAEGAEVEAIVADLTADGAPDRAIDLVVNRWGGIDVLINNAAYGIVEPFLNSTYSAWTRTMALNVTALAMSCKAAGRIMRDQRSGRIVNVTSPGSRMAWLTTQPTQRARPLSILSPALRRWRLLRMV